MKIRMNNINKKLLQSMDKNPEFFTANFTSQ